MWSRDLRCDALFPLFLLKTNTCIVYAGPASDWEAMSGPFGSLVLGDLATCWPIVPRALSKWKVGSGECSSLLLGVLMRGGPVCFVTLSS